jgi:hypothetical protein
MRHENSRGLVCTGPGESHAGILAGSKVGLEWVPRARANVCPGSLQAPRMVANCPWAVEHAASTLSVGGSRQPLATEGAMEMIFTHGARLDVL